jgi:hypothetical protein
MPASTINLTSPSGEATHQHEPSVRELGIPETDLPCEVLLPVTNNILYLTENILPEVKLRSNTYDISQIIGYTLDFYTSPLSQGELKDKHQIKTNTTFPLIQLGLEIICSLMSLDSVEDSPIKKSLKAIQDKTIQGISKNNPTTDLIPLFEGLQKVFSNNLTRVTHLSESELIELFDEWIAKKIVRPSEIARNRAEELKEDDGYIQKSTYPTPAQP